MRETGLEQGQFAEKGQRQRFLFMPYVKEYIRLYKSQTFVFGQFSESLK